MFLFDEPRAHVIRVCGISYETNCSRTSLQNGDASYPQNSSGSGAAGDNDDDDDDDFDFILRCSLTAVVWNVLLSYFVPLPHRSRETKDRVIVLKMDESNMFGGLSTLPYVWYR